MFHVNKFQATSLLYMGLWICSGGYISYKENCVYSKMEFFALNCIVD